MAWTTTAVAALALGLLLTADSAIRLSAELNGLSARRQTLADLRAIEKNASREIAALTACEQLAGPPPSIEEMLKQSAPAVLASFRGLDSAPLPGGWNMKAVEVLAGRISYPDLCRFLDAAAAARPPWQVRDISLSASEQDASALRASLRFEAPVNNSE